MSVTPGTRFGPYEVAAKLGAGGMGEVYRARDTKLNRDVAIKVLPDVFALDAERLARFTREAQVLASLNHPNIAAIYGIEEQRSTRALVMELVEGDDLSQRIARGAIPLDEALPIARQIAEALEAAHEQGVVHRDLKPANIKVRPDGTVKVLDFGLAKALDPTAASASTDHAPTITSPAMTQRGMILGTPAYMSPEQAKGKPVDKRADNWAFGAVLFEMLAGSRAFEGDDVSEVMAGILKLEPTWSRLPADLPEPVRRVLRRCLEKEPKRRLRDVAEGMLQLEDALAVPNGLAFAPGTTAPTRVPAAFWRRTFPWALAVVALSAAVGTGLWAPRRNAAPGQVMRFSFLPSTPAASGTMPFDTVAISPDGKLVAYVTADGAQLVIRPIDRLDAEPLPGIRTARSPFFSPDGQWVGFFQGPSELKKVSVSGGPAVTVCKIDSPPRGASWGDDHTIVFATTAVDSGLWAVPDSGGEPRVLSTPDASRGEVDHLHPFVLPGSRTVLFTAAARPIGDSQIAALDLATGTMKVLLRGGSEPVYLDPGVVVYGVANTLLAVRFDLQRLEVQGGPVPVAEHVATVSNMASQYAISGTGSLIYAPGEFRAQEIGDQELVWIDRKGTASPVKGAAARAYHMLRLSPDGTKVALGIRDQENDIWVFDLAREAVSRLTVDPGFDTDAVWTPDGRRIAFSGPQGGGAANIFWQAADGAGTPERLTKGNTAQSPNSFTPDGKSLVFRADGAIHLLAMDSRQASLLIRTQLSDRGGELSPDGRFLAYEWTQSGTPQIYVQAFPDVGGGRWQVSQDGGRKPAWAPSGRELFYIGGGGGLYAVPIQTSPGFSSGNPARLFDLGDLGNSYNGRPYDATPDGQRFIALRSIASTAERGPRAPQPLVVVVNWIEDVKAKLGIER